MRRPSPRVALALGTALAVQWALVLALIGFSLRALVLSGLALALVAIAAEAAAGRGAAAAATVFALVAPAFQPFWRSDFRPHWRHEVLPVLYGAQQSARVGAGILLLAALIALLRLPARNGVPAAAALAVAAGALVRLDEATIVFHWHAYLSSISGIREVGWSKRVVEYFPIAGAVALAVRRRPAVLPLVVLLIAAVVVPLGRDRGLVANAIAVVPGLPAYAVLAGCIVLLVPQPMQARLARLIPAR